MDLKAATLDTASIPGWGVDADERNDPTYPMRDRTTDSGPGIAWIPPSPQPSDVEILMSSEHNRRPAVFGTASPPTGLSGMIRRQAFKWSESRATHWFMLVAADRINVVEGVILDILRGRPPNIYVELGLPAARRYDRRAYTRRMTVAAAVGLAAVAAVVWIALDD